MRKKPETISSTGKPVRRKRGTRNTAAPFERALSAAADRLVAAIAERAIAGERLAVLNAEIPQLERTLAVLRDQVTPKPVIEPAAVRAALNESQQHVNSFAGMSSGPPLTSQSEIHKSVKMYEDDDNLPEIE